MNAVGGYFGLELKLGKEYHSDAVRLNTARNSLEYILRAKKYKKIYLPFYSCDVLLQPFHRLDLEYEFYSINENFEPLFDFSAINEKQAFLYINYFGLKRRYISELKEKCSNLIVDNAQAFYERPHENVDTIYSPRKFFGLPDGGYLYSSKKDEEISEQDLSYKRADHLLRRIDVSAEDGYKYFIQNETSLDNLPILKMSNLTHRMLQSIDYEGIALRRMENFKYLHNELRSMNGINIELTSEGIPMTYPFLTRDPNLRGRLIKNRIYVPQYWPNVLTWVKQDTIEYKYAQNLIPLPIDQRLHLDDFNFLIDLVKYARVD